MDGSERGASDTGQLRLVCVPDDDEHRPARKHGCGALRDAHVLVHRVLHESADMFHLRRLSGKARVFAFFYVFLGGV
jgi:hypothetical protein